jgi:hypothetical protein
MMSCNLKTFLVSLTLVVLVLSCKNQKKTEESPLVPVTLDSTGLDSPNNYLPIAVLLKGEMKWVEDFAGAILLKTKTDSKKDSAYISLDEFKKLGNSVISAEMDSAYFVGHFKEESIADGGSEGLTFIYTGNSTGELKKVMVYINRTETSDKVGRVYFEKEIVKGDTSIVQRCTWKLQHYLMIVESKQIGNGNPSTTVRKAIYDPAEYATD